MVVIEDINVSLKVGMLLNICCYDSSYYLRDNMGHETYEKWALCPLGRFCTKIKCEYYNQCELDMEDKCRVDKCNKCKARYICVFI